MKLLGLLTISLVILISSNFGMGDGSERGGTLGDPCEGNTTGFQCNLVPGNKGECPKYSQIDYYNPVKRYMAATTALQCENLTNNICDGAFYPKDPQAGCEPVN